MIKSHENLIVTRTFSKGFGLPGIRFGYGLFHEKHWAQIIKTESLKNITRITAKVVIAALNSLDFYKSNWNKIKTEYKRIRAELSKIIKFNKAVFAFELGDAPFYMVYCKNPKQLCEFFESHGCLIRNKSSEIKFGVRISIDLPEVNDYAINLLKIFNEQNHIQNNYADLDGTLRAGCLEGACLYKNAKLLCDKLALTVITNNVDYTPDEINKQIAELNLGEKRLITPLTRMKKLIGKYPFVHGNESIQKFLGHRPVIEKDRFMMQIISPLIFF